MEIWKVYVINKQEEVKGVIFPHGEMYGSFCLFYYFFWSKLVPVPRYEGSLKNLNSGNY